MQKQERVKDVVCGMEFDRSESHGQVNYNGTIYDFCSIDCRNKFQRNPGSYPHQDFKAALADLVPAGLR